MLKIFRHWLNENKKTSPKLECKFDSGEKISITEDEAYALVRALEEEMEEMINKDVEWDVAAKIIIANLSNDNVKDLLRKGKFEEEGFLDSSCFDDTWDDMIDDLFNSEDDEDEDNDEESE